MKKLCKLKFNVALLTVISWITKNKKDNLKLNNNITKLLKPKLKWKLKMLK